MSNGSKIKPDSYLPPIYEIPAYFDTITGFPQLSASKTTLPSPSPSLLDENINRSDRQSCLIVLNIYYMKYGKGSRESNYRMMEMESGRKTCHNKGD